MKTFFLILLIFIPSLSAQQYPYTLTDNNDWYPLSIGNLWVYENYYNEDGIIHFTGYSWELIKGIVTLSNEEQYFEVLSHKTDGTIDTLYLRLDSLFAIIYGYDKNSGDELLYEDLSAKLGDTVCYEYNPYWYCQIVQAEEEYSVWGLLTLRKELFPDEVGWICNHTLLMGIGLYNYGCGDLYSFYSNLMGCKINGVVYGNVSVVDVDDKSITLPAEFSLFQNFPNPFNPTTKIKYGITSSTGSPLLGGARGGLVTLKVYDILGREVATLVNEEKPAGEYEIEFDGSNLSSGIYFYQLKAGSIIQTNKMVFLK